MKKIFSILLILLLFTGCSNKTEVKEIDPEKISMLVAYDADHNVVSTVVYYDGEEVEKVEFNNPNEVDYYVKNLRYSADGFILESENYDKDMNLTSAAKFEAKDGDYTAYKTTDKDGNVTGEMTSVFDDEGHIASQDYIFGNSTTHVMYAYDDNGNLIKEEGGYYDEDGELVLTNYFIYEYDGDKITTYYNSLEDESSSYINVTEYNGNKYNYKSEKYDLDNNLISVTTVESYDNLIDKSYKLTDAQGNVQKEYRHDEYGAIVYMNLNGTVYEAK